MNASALKSLRGDINIGMMNAPSLFAEDAAASAAPSGSNPGSEDTPSVTSMMKFFLPSHVGNTPWHFWMAAA